MTASIQHSQRNPVAQVVKDLKARLSLRAPQAESLEKLDLAIQNAKELLTKRGRDTEVNKQTLAKLQTVFPKLADFERDFPSICFSLATGVGKTRLMGAFIAYLHLAYGINNFFVLAPNLTIYEKLITDFTPNTPKYVFANLAQFNFQSPMIITGDNYDSRDTATASLLGQIRINVFNISKINSEVRGGKEPRIKRMREVLGESYFNHLAGLDDLVLLMDESHRYRASAGIKAINELNPLMGLEVTATPFVETTKGPVAFKNVVMDYPLARAMEDGFVKEPAVVTQRNFDPKGLSTEQIEEIKLKDGIRLHEMTKVHLINYAQNTGQSKVKPFVLIIARDTTHAAQLKERIESDEFFKGQYKDKVIQVDSSTKEEEITQRLLSVEDPNEPTEIVIHVNMLKEGWDVTNLYTIIPLRAANARTLVEQSIGRGLRLPYGKRTGVEEVDRLSIVAHDRFQDIVDEANREDSILKLKTYILEPENEEQGVVSVTSTSRLDAILGTGHSQQTDTQETIIIQDQLEQSNEGSVESTQKHELDLTDPTVIQAIKQVQKEIQAQAKNTETVKHSEDLKRQEVQAEMTANVLKTIQENLSTIVQELDFGEAATSKTAPSEAELRKIVEQVTEVHIQNTIDIPRISVTPSEDVTTGYNHFTLNTQGLHLQPQERELLGQNLRDNSIFSIKAEEVSHEKTPQDRIVYALIDFDDVDYFTQSELLYDLANQIVSYLKTYLTDDEVVQVVEQNYQTIANNIHGQMQQHYWEKASNYNVVISRSFVELKQPSFTAAKDIPPQSIRATPPKGVSIKKLLFTDFSKCLMVFQKFDSDTERRFAIILERDSNKWFKPAKGQFQIYYNFQGAQPEYIPDFVVETESYYLLAETKAENEMTSEEVIIKAQAGSEWCKNASTVSTKPWHYLLIPHNEVVESKRLNDYLRFRFES
ncbi:DEAD/DEAH box helicase family protein [Acinetobacter nosocomialis]|uniref:DEAD/DEAH box helicase n=1 Tax=Acinetobacter calcoaceticus/baumannii complex TaxID=909768 RepID=UPI00044CC40F|nr:DEAD/DEAH box helicase family protein [Acinetobacter baumannii]EXA87240.1 type III restriction enzyme, res subunit [Acinetobacter baumannii 118362]SSS79022.1 type III restriction-modification system StyLTI enzyme res [Acinetobacter baumannii]